MITVTWKTKSTLDSIGRLQVAFRPAMERATREVFRRMLARVILLTPKPPSPENQTYERTGRLVSGWGPAAKEVGLIVPEPIAIVPRDQGRFTSTIASGEIRLQAINDVPYGIYPEFGVPGKVPEHAMVRKGIAQTDAAGDFAQAVQAEWARL